MLRFVLAVDFVFVAPSWLHTCVLSLRSLLRGTFDAFFDWFIAKKIDKFSKEARLVRLVQQVRDVLFFDDGQVRSAEQQQQRKDEALKCIEDLCPSEYTC